MNNVASMNRFLTISLAFLLAACSGGGSGESDESVNPSGESTNPSGGSSGSGGGSDSSESADSSAENANPYQPPLYWNVYEYHIVRQQEMSDTEASDTDSSNKEVSSLGENFIPESEFLANIDWVEANLKPYGYEMVAIDGWGDTQNLSENGYRASHSENWEQDYAWWSAHLLERGMRLGMYENPMIVHVASGDVTSMIVGTDIPVSTLSDDPFNEGSFRWVNVERPGAEEYIKGYIKYYTDMGIDHLRIDFLSWFENGYDRYLGQIGERRPRENYATALRWMREAADEYGMLLSFAMPHMYDQGELERQYAHSVRISEDTDYGEWWKFSSKDRGTFFYHWPQWANVVDGLTHWSYISGRDKVRLDGDFIRMNTYSTDVERRTVISMHLMAGGPIAVADRYDTIGDSLWVYQNEELLALNKDAFVGKPRTNDPRDENSQVWTGRMSNGDTVIGLFNRESTPRTRSLSFVDVGVEDDVIVRDLWQHASLGSMSTISVELAPHASMIVQLTPGVSSCSPQSVQFDEANDVQYGDPGPTLSATATSGLSVQFDVALGPATVAGSKTQPTGKSGIVYVVASQPGNDTWCAAMPVVGSFAVLGGHQQVMYIGATFTDWVPDIAMELEGDTWVAEDVQIPAGEQEFKFASSGDWSQDDWGNAQGFSGTLELTTGGGPNVSISVPETASYRFNFNDLTLEYSVERVDEVSE